MDVGKDKVLLLAFILTIGAGSIIGILATRGVPAVPIEERLGVGEVETANLADEAVTTAKIANGAVTTGKIADGAVTSAKINDGTITTADIADGAITSAKIADASIETADIQDDAITGAKINDGTISAADLGVPPGSATYVVATSSTYGDYTDIQSAINALPSGGGLIRIREGIYIISSSIQVPSNVALVGAGPATIIKVSASVDVIKNRNASGDENIVIAQLSIDANGGLNGIYFDNVSNSKIFGVWIKNAGSDGINIGEASENNVIANNIILFSENDGITLYSVGGIQPRYNVITGNVSENNTLRGITLWEASNNIVTNNVARKNGEYGIRIAYDANYNMVSGNMCESNVGYGIWISGASNNTIANNISTGNTWDGIKLENSDTKTSTQNTISGNQCSGNTSYGIYLTSESNQNTISGNQCSGTTNNDGIYIENSHQNTISGNQCTGNGQFGILVKQSDNNVLSANRTHVNQWNIKIENSDNNLLVGNHSTASWGSIGIQIDSNSENNKLVGNYSYGNGDGDLLDSGVGTKYIETADISGLSITNDNIYGLSITIDNIYGLMISNENIENLTIRVENVANDNLTPSVMAFAPGSATYVVSTSNDNGDFDNIEQAIEALPSTGGTVHIREGTYTITDNIEITNSNVALIGAGAGTLIETSSSINVIDAWGVENILIKNLRIRGGTKGIVFTSVVSSQIIECWVEGTTSNGIELSSSENCVVGSNIVRSTGDTGIMIWQSNYNTISGNISELNTNQGVYIGGDAWGSQNTIANNVVNYNSYGINIWRGGQSTITGNVFKHNTNWGINISSGYELSITGNQFENNDNGIYLTTSGRNTITANTIHNTANDGIKLDSSATDNADNNIVSGNVIDGNDSGTGVVLNGGCNTIIGNYIGNHYYGVGFWGGDNCSILSNRFWSNAGNGIYLDSNSINNLISNNDLMDGGTISDGGAGTLYGAGNRLHGGDWKTTAT